MRVIDLGGVASHSVPAFGSEGFAVGRLGAGCHVVAAVLSAGGRIGRHDAPVAQLLVVVAGDVTVAGADGVPATLMAGHAAYWEAGESHETSSAGGATLLLVEGEALAATLGAEA